RTVEKVAEKVSKQGVNVSIERINILSKDTVAKYGLLFSPAVAFYCNRMCMGRVPTEEDVEKMIFDEVI
ncbi:MAG: hypothetical protein QW738_00960, partial [Nitrososphaeria archaeon]